MSNSFPRLSQPRPANQRWSIEWVRGGLSRRPLWELRDLSKPQIVISPLWARHLMAALAADATKLLRISNVPMTSSFDCCPGPEVPIVYDFPAPDWPYARMETLYPCMNEFTLSLRYSQTPAWSTPSPKTRSKTKSFFPCCESTAMVVSLLTWQALWRNLWGISSKFGSPGFSGGRTRMAAWRVGSARTRMVARNEGSTHQL